MGLSHDGNHDFALVVTKGTAFAYGLPGDPVWPTTLRVHPTSKCI